MHDLIFSLGPDISEAEFEQFFRISIMSDDFIHRIEFGAFVNKVPNRDCKEKNREVTNAQGNTFMNGMREDKVEKN